MRLGRYSARRVEMRNQRVVSNLIVLALFVSGSLIMPGPLVYGASSGDPNSNAWLTGILVAIAAIVSIPVLLISLRALFRQRNRRAERIFIGIGSGILGLLALLVLLLGNW